MDEVPCDETPTGLEALLPDVRAAAKAVTEAVNCFLRIQATLRRMGRDPELENVISQQVAIDVLSSGAIPLPVGTEGTTSVVNNTDETVILKMGSSHPVATAGSIMIEIPPGESASILKSTPSAPPLITQNVIYRHIEPCFPPIAGQLCLEPPLFERDTGTGPGNAVNQVVGWKSEIRVGKVEGGLSLTGS